MLLKQKTVKLRILDFDIETRPLSFWGVRPTAEITAIGMCWADDPNSMEVYLLGRDTPLKMLVRLIARFNEADMVTAHNIRRFDLPMINGALMEYNLPQLPPKLAQDTYNDLKKRGDIPGSQEYLLDLFGLGKKVHMGQYAWRKANRLSPEGIQLAYDRVSGDVYDHMRLRTYMVNHNLLKPPKIWKP